ncbi:MAG: AIR synthase-related protein, partial [bacterium]|nr:AIR synthase-related protein [bacterium]
ARKAAFDIGGLKVDSYIEELHETVYDAMMKVHRTYLPIVRPLLEKFSINGMAHITGGGVQGNLVRVLPDDCCAEIDKNSWPVLPLFEWLREIGNIDPVDIYRSFNMGIGYILVVPAESADSVSAAIKGMGEEVYRIGEIKSGPKEVRLID